ncbi:MAG: hypothetical protein CFE31_18930 [Rhizobiales bacterium PAR1]|nr:MAG: hypothetical protein CFE31_18930 [Rhizobiales bacterium PAR1]
MASGVWHPWPLTAAEADEEPFAFHLPWPEAPLKSLPIHLLLPVMALSGRVVDLRSLLDDYCLLQQFIATHGGDLAPERQLAFERVFTHIALECAAFPSRTTQELGTKDLILGDFPGLESGQNGRDRRDDRSSRAVAPAILGKHIRESMIQAGLNADLEAVSGALPVPRSLRRFKPPRG